MKRNILVFMLLTALLSSIFAVQDEGVATKLKGTDKTEYTIGFTLFKNIRLEKENMYLLYSLAMLIKEGVESIKTHYFSLAEAEAYQQEIYQKSLRFYTEQIAKLLVKRDALVYSELPAHTRKATLDSYNQQLTALRTTLDLITALPLKAIPVPASLPVKIVLKGEELLEAPQFSAAQYAENQNLDLVIWGSIEQIDQYLYVSMGVYNRILAKNVAGYEFIANPFNVYEEMEEAVKSIAVGVLGRNWARLKVAVLPDDSIIEINGQFQGIGTADERYILPGDYQIKIIRPGYRTIEEMVTVGELEEKELTYELKIEIERKILLSTNPPGADVYLNSVWIGQTPLEISLAQRNAELVVKREGYLSYRTTLNPDIEGESLEISLKEDIIEEFYWQEKKRDDFYFYFGLWALSVPIPLFLYAYYNDINNSGASNIQDIKFLYYNVYGVSIFITAVLFVNMMVYLLDYINHTDYLTY